MERNHTQHPTRPCKRRLFPQFQMLLVAALLSLCQSVPPSTAAVSERQVLAELLDVMFERLATPAYGDARSYMPLFTGECSLSRESFEDEILRERGRLAGKDRGLELRGGLSTSGLSGSESDVDPQERGRGTIELSWDVLKSGYAQNSARKKALILHAQEEQLREEQNEVHHELLCRQQRIETVFGQLIATLLNWQLDFLEPVYRVERRAYFKKWSFLDDYLVSEQDLVLITQELNHLLRNPLPEQAIMLERLPPIIDIDLAGLLRLIETDEQMAALFAVREKRYKQDERSVYHDSLRLFLRREFAGNSSSTEQNEVVAGFRFQVPLYTRSDTLTDLQLRQLNQQKRMLQWDRLFDTRAAYRGFQEQLNRTLAQHYRHARALERMRRTLLMIERGDTQLLTTGITRMRTLFEARSELGRSLKELYLRVNELFRAAGVPFHSELVSPVVLEPKLRRARAGQRALYVWSDDLDRLTDAELLHFLEAKNISRIFLSTSRNIEPARRDELIKQLRKKSVKVEMLLGEASWIMAEKQDLALEKSLIAAELTGSVHLDVEPHTLPDYQKHRDEYLLLYQELIEALQTRMLDRSLSVAVPFHWPLDCYRRLAAAVDTIYVMAYGSEKADTVIRRIKRIQPVVPIEKLGVALRSSDFVDEWALEQLIDRLVLEIGVERIAIHDLGGYLTLTSVPYEVEN